MRFKTLILFIMWAGFAVCVCSSEGHEDGGTVQDLIQGVVARSDALFSGKIDYRQKSGFVGRSERNPIGDYKVIFSGSSWRIYSKYIASEMSISHHPSQRPHGGKSKLDGFLEITNLSHGGKSVKYNVTPQYNGSIRNSAHIAKEKSIGSLSSTYNAPPMFAGSFWFDCTKQFIQKHKDRAARKPDAEVNGVKTQVLEWSVPEAEKFEAFHAIPSQFRGGFLRLYVAPELGSALPRIENIDMNGDIVASFDSSDFMERAAGIFIPRRCRMQYYTNREADFYVEYEITDVMRINEQIADSEFIVQLPGGTLVSDGRNGKSSTIFTIREGGPIPADLGDILAVPPAPFWGLNWHTALIVGVGAAVLLLAVYFLYHRFVLRRQMP